MNEVYCDMTAETESQRKSPSALSLGQSHDRIILIHQCLPVYAISAKETPSKFENKA
jgi:hypothetical protein